MVFSLRAAARLLLAGHKSNMRKPLLMSLASEYALLFLFLLCSIFILTFVIILIIAVTIPMIAPFRWNFLESCFLCFVKTLPS